MPKRIRESRILEQVRRWRAEAYESVRRQPQATRLQRAREWAARLDLPIMEEDFEGRMDTNTETPEA